MHKGVYSMLRRTQHLTLNSWAISDVYRETRGLAGVWRLLHRSAFGWRVRSARASSAGLYWLVPRDLRCPHPPHRQPPPPPPTPSQQWPSGPVMCSGIKVYLERTDFVKNSFLPFSQEWFSFAYWITRGGRGPGRSLRCSWLSQVLLQITADFYAKHMYSIRFKEFFILVSVSASFAGFYRREV